jgi:methionyl-tRNA formyltransferase
MLKIVFMGSDAIALPALEWLGGSGSAVGQIVAVFTQPDRASGRGQKVQPNAIKQWAQARGIPVHQPDKFGENDRAVLASYSPDLSLVMAYGHILRSAVIDTPRLGTLNLHASLLPKLRGASPIPTAIATGERETGVALMRIVPALDAGPVADAERFPIGPLDTAVEVEARLAEACVPLLARCLPGLAEGTLNFLEQDHARATFCRRLEKGDGALDFTRSAGELAARINGLMPWPGSATEFAGQPLKLGLAEACHPPNGKPAQPGAVLGMDDEGLLVACGEGALRVRRLQRPGGRMLPAHEFVRGCPIAPCEVLPSRPMPPLVAAQPFPRVKG